MRCLVLLYCFNTCTVCSTIRRFLPVPNGQAESNCASPTVPRTRQARAAAKTAVFSSVVRWRGANYAVPQPITGLPAEKSERQSRTANAVLHMYKSASISEWGVPLRGAASGWRERTSKSQTNFGEVYLKIVRRSALGGSDCPIIASHPNLDTLLQQVQGSRQLLIKFIPGVPWGVKRDTSSTMGLPLCSKYPVRSEAPHKRRSAAAVVCNYSATEPALVVGAVPGWISARLYGYTDICEMVPAGGSLRGGACKVGSLRVATNAKAQPQHPRCLLEGTHGAMVRMYDVAGA